jgi:hypothetical protein
MSDGARRLPAPGARAAAGGATGGAPSRKRATYDAYGRDWEFNTASLADDYEFHMAGANRIPGIDIWRGPDGYVAGQRHFLEFLDVDRVELDDLIPLGSGRVVALMRFVVRAGSGTIDQQALDVIDFRDGQVYRQTMWFDRDEGLRELGLS